MKFFKVFALFGRTYRPYRWHMLMLSGLGFLGALLEGIGINAAIPLLSFLVSSGKPTDFISTTVQSLFLFLHLPFTFRYLLGFIVALFVFRSVAQVAFGYLRGKITANFLNNESKDVLSKIFSASWPYLLKQRLGYIHGTTVQDVQKSAILLEVLGQSIQSFTGFFMYLLIALNISALTTLATLVAGVVLLLIVRPLMRKIQAVGNSMVAVEKDVAQFLAEHVLGLKAIKASAVEHQALTYGQGLFQHMRSLNIRMTFIRSVSTSLFQPFGIFFIIILFSISYHSPGFSLISFAATLYLIQKIFTYLESGQSSVNSVNELLPYAENVETFKHQLQEHAETMTSGNEPFVLTNSIAFSSVSLTYQGTVSALTNATFTINKGDTVGLIGPSGAGKTSIADLVLRLFEPTSGKILVDGTPLHNISMNEWRHNVGYVPQDIFLLNTTIEENIRFYRPELTHEEIVEAAKKANSYNFIMSLENGFETSIGDRGVMLSGGQRQRIVLTRALAGNPEILILDEATSALDNESEAVIQEAIHNLHRSITVLIIAHRLSTVESADKVVVLEKGKVIEQGSPKELDADEASYYHRVKHGL